MARPCPHPLALFSLRPYHKNERAERLVAHSNNSHNVSTLSDSTLALDVGFHLHGKSSKTLVTLGRGVDTDIYLEGSGVSRVQCSFEIDLDTGVVMLYDRSFPSSTQVFGENATPFQRERDQRKVLVQKDLNAIIGMGGERRDLVQFELEWHQDPTQTAKAIKDYDALPCGRVENPRLARTVDEAQTDLPSRRETRPHTPGQRQLKMRYLTVGPKLGSGQFGTVHKAIDVDSGKLMAVKILVRPTRASEQEDWRQSLYYALKREVETLSEISHPHIVEIFMGLKEGTLETLIDSGADASAVANSAFPQMLQALDCIAWKGIIHRGVKPENVLYVSLSQPDSQYQFQLGDFGLCNRIIDAATFAGTYLYMPPEMLQEGDQTHKVDVWSLFVTMMWILDAGGFRQRSNRFKSVAEVQRAVLPAASNVDSVSEIREMAFVNPEERASAAQMLVEYFDGAGLSTPRNQVPALTSSPPPPLPLRQLELYKQNLEVFK
ncbi:kinase-like protein [Lojkania enalia]|uniref:non-specific serine/threonine protein kinase n=1 Tax=Lojkania enalia TaxID=147567 RepID=A0A9P4JX46_9PLEO|nr:kinase-like protein [Didymosphaeria enalia]